MAKQTINIGAAANDGTGDPIRTAFGKVNDNFTEIYTANTGVNTGDQNLSAYATTAAVAAGYQPLDSDLTAIAALTTTAYGRALLSTADAPTLRTAIGLGQTDAPTFLAQSLTGQSLTGTQATSLVDLATTWNTDGNPSLIYGRVTNTKSGTTANLIDLGTVAGGSLFTVTKTGIAKADSIQLTGGGASGTATISGQNAAYIHVGGSGHIKFVGAGSMDMASFKYDAPGLSLPLTGCVNWTGSSSTTAAATSVLTQDAPGILAQRNGVLKQAFRVYNTNLSGAPEWAEFDWITSGTGNTLRIGTNKSGDGVARPIEFVIGGVARWQITAAGYLMSAGATDNLYDIGASGANRPRNVYAGSAIKAQYFQTNVSSSYLQFGTDAYIGGGGADGVILLSNNASTNFNRIQFGSGTDNFPAIARDGAGIKFTGAATGSTSWIKVPAVAVSALPSAATAGVGARSFVNDALTPVFGSAVTGGGAVTVPVYSTGSAWNVG